MIWLKWTAVGVLAVVLLAGIVLVAGALLSLDWRRGASHGNGRFGTILRYGAPS